MYRSHSVQKGASVHYEATRELPLNSSRRRRRTTSVWFVLVCCPDGSGQPLLASGNMSATEDDTELRDLLIQNLENNGVLNKLKVRNTAFNFKTYPFNQPAGSEC